MKRTYGYGIVDRHGKPWWNESCVCQDLGPMLEQVKELNDPDWWPSPDAPYRVVRLFWISKARK